VIDHPRQCVFAGTINPLEGYLNDPTGARRFWPVVCRDIDLETLVRDRDQLWAEARVRFQAGMPWWLDTPELEALARPEQEARCELGAPVSSGFKRSRPLGAPVSSGVQTLPTGPNGAVEDSALSWPGSGSERSSEIEFGKKA
jgi:hypothetical protein